MLCARRDGTAVLPRCGEGLCRPLELQVGALRLSHQASQHRRAVSTRSQPSNRSRQGPLRDSFTTLLLASARPRPMLESLPPVWLRRASAQESPAETPRGEQLARLVECSAPAVGVERRLADVELISSGRAWIGRLGSRVPRAPRLDSSSSVVSHSYPHSSHEPRVGPQLRPSPSGVAAAVRSRACDGPGRWRLALATAGSPTEVRTK